MGNGLKYVFNYKWTLDLEEPHGTTIIELSTNSQETFSKEHGKMIITHAFLTLRNGDYLLMNMLMTPISINSNMTLEYAQHLSQSLVQRIMNEYEVVELLDLHFSDREHFEKAGEMRGYYTKKEYDNL